MNEGGRVALDSTTFNLRTGSLSLTLRFSGAAFSALKSDIAAGFFAAPRRGAEAGGILLGDMAQQGSQWAVMVDMVTPVPIEHQYGPTYRLSTADKQCFRELAQAGDFASRPIGWYRGNTRPEKEIDEADRQISQTFFGINQSLFLLCEPSSAGRIQAVCHVMLPRRTEVAFSFELGEFSALDSLPGSRLPEPLELAKGPAAAPGFTPPGFTPIAVSVPGPEPRIPAPAPPPAAHRTQTAPPILTPRNLKVAALVAAAGLLLWFARGRAFAPPTPVQSASAASPAAPVPASLEAPALGLRAEYQGSSLLLGWDRSSPYAAAAVSGAVTIADGNRTRIIRLTPRDLQTGSILYKPTADDINVELDISTSSGLTGSQSIRIIGAAPPAAVPPTSPASSQSSPQRPVRLAPQVIPQPAPRQPALQQSLRPAARFQSPPAAAPARRSVSTADAPVIADPQPETGTVLLPSAVVLPPRPDAATAPPGAQQPGRPLTPPAPANASAPPRPGVPSTARTVSHYEPPVAIHSPVPPFPLNTGISPGMLEQPLEVKVEIHIDATGRVTSAKLSQENRVYVAALASSALSAARAWVFRPAMLGGQPIESTMVLNFRYRAPTPRE